MSLPRGLFGQLQVVNALILRETRTRFGDHQLGYIWAVLEPVFFVLPFFILYEIAEKSAPPGMSLFGFLVTGAVTFQAFGTVRSKVHVAIESNRGLLFYPHVHPLDLYIARIILETATAFTSFVILMAGEAIVAGSFEIDSPLLVLLGFALASLLGGALGMFLSSLAVYSPTVDRIAGPLLRPLFWVSGIFFTANDLPEQIQTLFSYNPLLHAIELVRTGWFVNYNSRSADILYLTYWVVGLFFLGLALERSARSQLEF